MKGRLVCRQSLRTLRRRLVIFAVVWHALGAVLLLCASVASAEPGGPSDEAEGPARPSASAGSYFGWMDVRDSSGINIWAYHLEFSSGGWRNPAKTVFNILVQLEYETFRAITSASIWFLGYAMSFNWLPVLISPARSLGDAMQSIVDSMGLTPLLLTVVGLMAGIWLLRGRFATSIFELLSACFIASVSVSVALLSNPVDRIAGDDGWLMKGRDAGLEIAVGLSNDGNMNGSPSENLKIVQMNLADSMVRRPTQLVNFGSVIDDKQSAECVKAWDDGQRSGKDLVDKVKDKCKYGEEMAHLAENPGSGQAFGGLGMTLFGSIFAIFAIAVGGSVLMAAGWAVFAGVKLVIASVAGIVSGPGRDMWWRCLSGALMATLMVVFAIAFAMGYMRVVDSFFSAGDNPVAKFMFVDVSLIGGVFLLRSVIKRFRANSEKLASKLSSARPGGGPSSLTRQPGLSPLAATSYAMNVASTGMRLAKTAASGVGAVASAGSRAAGSVRDVGGGVGRSWGGGDPVAPGSGPGTASQAPNPASTGPGDSSERPQTSPPAPSQGDGTASTPLNNRTGAGRADHQAAAGEDEPVLRGRAGSAERNPGPVDTERGEQPSRVVVRQQEREQTDHGGIRRPSRSASTSVPAGGRGPRPRVAGHGHEGPLVGAGRNRESGS